MNHDRSDLLQGTLELLILKVLSLEPMHGWGIAQRIQQVSRETFQVNHGSLYPALQKMTGKGWVTADWRTTEVTVQVCGVWGRERASWDA